MNKLTNEEAKKRTIERLARELEENMNKQAPKIVVYSSAESGTEVVFTHRSKKVEIYDPNNALPMGVRNAVTTVARAASYKRWLTERGFVAGGGSGE